MNSIAQHHPEMQQLIYFDSGPIRGMGGSGGVHPQECDHPLSDLRTSTLLNAKFHPSTREYPLAGTQERENPPIDLRTSTQRKAKIRPPTRERPLPPTRRNASTHPPTRERPPTAAHERENPPTTTRTSTHGNTKMNPPTRECPPTRTRPSTHRPANLHPQERTIKSHQAQSSIKVNQPTMPKTITKTIKTIP